MYLSVIVPTFNGADTIAEQLDALANQVSPGPFEVIISDNGSRDGTAAVVSRFKGRVPGLRIVDSSDRPGRSHARNVGADAATGDGLAFTDQDDVVGQAWVHAIGAALERSEFVTGSIETKQLNQPWRIERFSWPERQLRIHQYPPHLAVAPGTNLGVRRSLHQRIGGFDETLMLAWEDSDYAFRIQFEGIPLRFVEDAVVHYRLRHDFSSIYRQAQAYGEGAVVFYKKYEAIARVSEPWTSRLQAWTSLFGARTIVSLRKRSNLTFWLCRLGWRVGHVRGCVKHHVLAPSYWM